ncbi:MAG: DUF6364 family protein [Bacteroidota bacterium]
MANLHLVVDEEIKQKAKAIAKQRSTNLSALVEDFLFSLVRQERSITLSAELLDVELLQSPADDKKARTQYLDEKYGTPGSTLSSSSSNSRITSPDKL